MEDKGQSSKEKVIRPKKSCDNIENYGFMVDSRFMSRVMSSLYSNSDIFLRELISNSSDALDKFSHKPPKEIDNTEELCIRIVLNEKNRTLTIIDNGIGMNRSQITNYLGIMARSGTKKAENKNYIGQFGIGFYSVFLVADKVTVTSQSRNHNQYILESSSTETFTVECGFDESLKRGTKVMLNIKDDKSKYLKEKFIKETVAKYFQLIKYPIKLLVQKEYDDAEYEVIHKVVEPFIIKHNINEEKNMCVYHLTVRRPLKFEAKLCIPNYKSYDLFDAKKSNVKLFSKNVLITDNCKEFIPDYLNFIEAIISSEDFSLHISREKLQFSKNLNYIRSNIETNALAVFEYMKAKNDIIYKKFYKFYSRNIKMGICEDSIYREKLLKLLIYRTSASGNEACSLKDYVDRMKQNQKYIYFITGETKKQVENSVFIEALKMRDIEVIYMTDPIDEFVVDKLQNFHGKPFMSVVRADLEFFENDDDRMKHLQKAARFERLCKIMQRILSDKVEKVVVSNRLITSPCCIVNSKYGWTANMEKVIKAQFLNTVPMNYSKAKMQFEINPDHDIIQKLLTNVNRENFNYASVEQFTILLFETACISSGFILEKPFVLTNIIYRMMN
ncbi:heat shock protein 83 [Solenopsis invicta]|uniref:heat shock protein 83 n=1 Tax=Solenopsis invicta TaxID=13686 RepID=UPI000595BC8E|nr:heat shock protein 83 [Solenopsis invicta]